MKKQKWQLWHLTIIAHLYRDNLQKGQGTRWPKVQNLDSFEAVLMKSFHESWEIFIKVIIQRPTWLPHSDIMRKLLSLSSFINFSTILTPSSLFITWVVGSERHLLVRKQKALSWDFSKHTAVSHQNSVYSMRYITAHVVRKHPQLLRGIEWNEWL